MDPRLLLGSAADFVSGQRILSLKTAVSDCSPTFGFALIH